MTRTAVFGGSFNPIHYGHLLLADDLLEILRLDRVLFVPAKHPPHKDPSRLARPEVDCRRALGLSVAARVGGEAMRLTQVAPIH